MSSSRGSLIAWSNDGARIGVGGMGEERDLTRARNLGASKVKAAPRRKWAVAGSGMEDRAERVRWKPSMGTNVAGGGREGSALALRRSVMIWEKVVLPEHS